MVVDTSAVISILRKEAGYELLVDKMADAASRSMSAASYVEASMVLGAKRGERALRELDSWLAEGAVSIVPVSVTHAKLARAAFLQFGKGRHPARLNFGDCFAYALARSRGEQILFVGDDFSLTDLEPA